MRGDDLGQGAAAEIDEMRRDRYGKRSRESRQRPIPTVRPQKAADDRRACQQRERRRDQWQVIARPIADDAGQLHEPGDCPGQEPGAHAELEFPRHDAVAEDESVGRLGRLKDLIVPIETRDKQHWDEPQPD